MLLEKDGNVCDWLTEVLDRDNHQRFTSAMVSTNSVSRFCSTPRTFVELRPPQADNLAVVSDTASRPRPDRAACGPVLTRRITERVAPDNGRMERSRVS